MRGSGAHSTSGSKATSRVARDAATLALLPVRIIGGGGDAVGLHDIPGIVVACDRLADALAELLADVGGDRMAQKNQNWKFPGEVSTTMLGDAVAPGS